ncbi:cysteine proteinase [Guyanagaster necrorhizus]|uniref:Ubiquitin carboxyl-terminal hydrolase n=1 Tax=Guyanagaster necrorhizus TaxID=856835 RepID=A0A9P8AX23_9AGAR|nr:cysteine proteinase [Guyanagaster necrorhizus MCA 3950]KAG7449482.1 cysteine proteinase [Guyanagaster necrorhizus MCA 3950]
MLASPLYPAPSPTFSPSHSNADDQLSCRPSRDLEAFNSLLPPPVEFIEGSSSGTLAVVEGKYDPINATPTRKASPMKEQTLLSQPSPVLSPKVTKRSVSKIDADAQSLYRGEVDTTWPSKFNIGSGLFNSGNTCFLNSVLQCLIHTPPLLGVLYGHNEVCRVKNVFCMACNLRSVCFQAYSNKSAFSPGLISTKLHFIAKHLKRGRQEDSHEFLRYAIDALQKSCLFGYSPKLDPKVAETSWVHKIFGGKLRSRVTCQSCGHNSDTYDSNLDVSLDIHRMSSVKDALHEFVAPDYLKGGDKYKCERCKRYVNAEKRFSIHKAPLVCTIHLKRFSPLGNKIGHQVNYDERLSLAPYMSEGEFGPLYSLYGVICHAGGGPNSGHYYAFVKSRSGDWYEMNDESVTRVHQTPVRKNAYILFYIRTKGDRLQAALSHNDKAQPMANGVHPLKGITMGMKRRRVKEDDDEDTGVKMSKPFIGPLLPIESDAANGPSDAKRQKLSPTNDPQADAMKKKIESAQKTLSSLAQYSSSDDSEEEQKQKEKEKEKEKEKRDGKEKDKPGSQETSGSAPPPEASPLPMTPSAQSRTTFSSPIPPNRFYSTSNNKHKRHGSNSANSRDRWQQSKQYAFNPYNRFLSGKKNKGKPRPL